MSQRTSRYNPQDGYHCLDTLDINGVSEEQTRWPCLWMSTVRWINAVSTQFASIYYMFLVHNHGTNGIIALNTICVITDETTVNVSLVLLLDGLQSLAVARRTLQGTTMTCAPF